MLQILTIKPSGTSLVPVVSEKREIILAAKTQEKIQNPETGVAGVAKKQENKQGFSVHLLTPTTSQDRTLPEEVKNHFEANSRAFSMIGKKDEDSPRATLIADVWDEALLLGKEVSDMKFAPKPPKEKAKIDIVSGVPIKHEDSLVGKTLPTQILEGDMPPSQAMKTPDREPLNIWEIPKLSDKQAKPLEVKTTFGSLSIPQKPKSRVL